MEWNAEKWPLHRKHSLRKAVRFSFIPFLSNHCHLLWMEIISFLQGMKTLIGQTFPNIPVYSWFQCIFPRNIWFHRNAINERDNFVFLITRTGMMDFLIVILKFVRWDFPSWSVCIFSSTWSNSRWTTTIFITFNDFKKWTSNLFNWINNQNNYCWI